MKKENKINFSIEKDDDIQNDFLYTWIETGERPSKIILQGYFSPDKFMAIINTYQVQELYHSTEIFPNEDVFLINQKRFFQIQNDIYLSFTHLDKLHEESIVGDVILLFPISKNEVAEKIIEEISELSISKIEEPEEVINNVNILYFNQTGFELEKIENTKQDFDDIEFYYEEDVLKKLKKSIKHLKKSKKSLTVICGERGCGKTNLLRYISSKLDNKIIFIPCTLIENSINNAEFRKFLSLNKNSILILDDVELYFSQMYSKSTFYTNNLLQLVDGFFSDSLNIQIILSLNCSINEVDKEILSSNNLNDVIEVDKLSVDKVLELSEYLNKKIVNKGSLKLIDILKDKCQGNNSEELGFK